MTIADLIAQIRAAMSEKLAQRNLKADELAELRSVDEPDEAKIAAVRAEITKLDKELDAQKVRVDELGVEQERDEAMTRLQSELHPTPAAARAAGDPAHAERAPVKTGTEERTYALHKERGFDQRAGKVVDVERFKPGAAFERDVAAAFLGDYSAQARLARHMEEERVERSAYADRLTQERAVGTGAFAGLTVPQYLTDMYAPAVAAMRPFADVCNKHLLPADGMTVNISRITTATSAALQASENVAVSETNIDDTLLTIPVQTNAGQQTMSRQSIERGTGTEAVVMDDLFRRYHSTLDSTLLNQASTGLAAASTLIAYTSAAPKVVELYPIVVSGLAAVEAAMLDQADGDNIVVMHSRRWYWLQNGLSATWPLIASPGVLAQNLGENYGVKYGSGVRGILPNGTAVIVDNNVTTAGLAGAVTGGTQDHVYVLSKREAHLWEDPSAPVFIRAEQPAAASLGVLLVLYGYFAYTFQRYTESQVISGTGTVPPAFTGV